jgi:hypothetical protein
MTSFRNGKEESSMHNYETSIFAEDRACGMWRLQTNEPTLVKVMNERAKQPRSPWKITGRGLTATDPMIYRRSFSSSTKAKISLERLLMRMDAEPYELVNVTVGKGWEVQRALRRENGLKPCHSSLNSESAEGELS